METTCDSAIEQIVQSIFATMLNDELVRLDESDSTDHGPLMATVQIAGQWMGSVVLALSPEVARAAAVAMLRITEQEVTEADQQEIAAEVVNIVGGNLKSILPGPSFLSLPTIVTGRAFDLQVHDAVLIDDVVMRSNCGSLRVRLYAKVDEIVP